MCKKHSFLEYKLRGALPGQGWYYHWYVQISIGNEFWGPLNADVVMKDREIALLRKKNMSLIDERDKFFVHPTNM
jgi:hypothetical protein